MSVSMFLLYTLFRVWCILEYGDHLSKFNISTCIEPFINRFHVCFQSSAEKKNVIGRDSIGRKPMSNIHAYILP